MNKQNNSKILRAALTESGIKLYCGDCLIEGIGLAVVDEEPYEGVENETGRDLYFARVECLVHVHDSTKDHSE